jgi:hypothetical protein
VRSGFRALAAVRTTGGSVTSQNGTMTVTGADAVTLLISIGSNYNNFQDVTGDQNGRARDPLLAAADWPYGELRSRHVTDYQPYFNRTTLDVGSTSAAELPTASGWPAPPAARTRSWWRCSSSSAGTCCSPAPGRVPSPPTSRAPSAQ